MAYQKGSGIISLFLMLTFLSHLIFMLSYHGEGYQLYTKYSFLTFMSVFLGVMWYLTVCTLSVKTDWFFNVLIIAGFANTLVLTGQYFGYNPLLVATDGSADIYPTGLFSNQNEASAFLAFCVPAFFKRRLWIGLIIIAWGLYCADSLGGPVAVYFGVSFWLWAKGHKLIPMISALILFFFACLFGSPLTALAERLPGYVLAIKLISKNWLFGYGPGMFKVISNLLEDQAKRFLHFEALQAVFEMGIFAGVLFLFYFRHFIKKIKETDIRILTGVVIVGVNSIIHFPFHIAPTALVGVTYLALMDKK